MACFYCGDESKELRPYGPGGSDVCFDCAMATPERRKIAEDAFAGRLAMAEASSPIGAAMVSGGMPPAPYIPDREES